MANMLVFGIALAMLAYLALQFTLHATQNKREPLLLECKVPFFDFAIGMMKHRAGYFARLRQVSEASTRSLILTSQRRTACLPIHTLRAPFHRIYVVHSPYLVQIIQSKTNAAIFVPNLLDFGMLFSGLQNKSKKVLRRGFSADGNSFTRGVHKYLLSGPTLAIATKAAVGRLSTSIPNSIVCGEDLGLLHWVRHELAMAFTGAVYGPENPYDDPEIERSWNEFVPGISHLLSSPVPFLTARGALLARSRVIDAFRKYFETGGHLQAFSMVPEMFEKNIQLGLTPTEAAKMEMATSLAMLSSGANTAFWLLYHIFSDSNALDAIRTEVMSITKNGREDGSSRVVRLDEVKRRCPSLVAMLNETLRLHSSVINIKEVQRDTTLANQYFLKKKAIVMIPGQSIHHEKAIWGPTAETFDHYRFLSAEANKKISSTAAFRPFGAGATMCPGRHFSTNVILSLAAMVVLQYDISTLDGRWRAPSKHNADIWNAMPKPDWDINVRFTKRIVEEQVKWKFVCA